MSEEPSDDSLASPWRDSTFGSPQTSSPNRILNTPEGLWTDHDGEWRWTHNSPQNNTSQFDSSYASTQGEEAKHGVAIHWQPGDADSSVSNTPSPTAPRGLSRSAPRSRGSGGGDSSLIWRRFRPKTKEEASKWVEEAERSLRKSQGVTFAPSPELRVTHAYEEAAPTPSPPPHPSVEPRRYPVIDGSAWSRRKRNPSGSKVGSDDVAASAYTVASASVDVVGSESPVRCKTCVQLRRRVDMLEASNAQLRTDNSAIQGRLQQLKTEDSANRQALEVLRKENERVVEITVRDAEEKAQLLDRYHVEKEEKRRVQKALDASVHSVKVLEEELQTQKAEELESSAALPDLEQELRAANEKIKSQLGEIQKLQQHNTKMGEEREAAVRSQLAEFQALKESHQELLKTHDRVLEDRQRVKKKLRQVQDGWKKDISASNKYEEIFKGAIETIKEKSRALEAEKGALKETVSELRSKLDSKQVENDHLTKDLTKATQDLAKTKASLTSALAQNVELQGVSKRLRSEMDQLQHTVDVSKLEIEETVHLEASQRSNVLQSVVQQLQGELQEVKRDLETQQHLNQSLTAASAQQEGILASRSSMDAGLEKKRNDLEKKRNDDLRSYQAENAELEGKCSLLEARLEDKEQEIESLKLRQQEELNKLHNYLQRAKEAMKTQSMTTKSTESRVKELETELATERQLRVEMSDVTGALADMDESTKDLLEDLRRQLKIANDAKLKADLEIRTLKIEKEKLKIQVSEAEEKKSYYDELDERNEDLATEQLELASQLSKLQVEIDGYSGALEAVATQVGVTRTGTQRTTTRRIIEAIRGLQQQDKMRGEGETAAQRKVTELEIDLEEQLTMRQQLESELAKIRQQLEEQLALSSKQSKDNSHLKSQVETLESSLVQKESVLKRTSTESGTVDTLKHRLANADSLNQKLRAENEELVTKVEKLQVELDDVEEEITTSKAEQDRLVDDQQRLQLELDSSRAKCQRFESDLAEQMKKMRSNDRAVLDREEEFEEKLSEAQRSLEIQQSENESLRISIDAISTKLFRHKEEKAEVEKALAALRKKNLELVGDLRDATSKVAEMEEKLKQTVDEFQTSIAKLEEELSKRTSTVKELERQSKGHDRKEKELKEQIEKWKSTTESQAEMYQEQIAELEKRADECKAEVEELQDSHKHPVYLSSSSRSGRPPVAPRSSPGGGAKDSEIRRLTRALQEAEDQNHELLCQLDAYSSRAGELENDVNDLKSRLEVERKKLADQSKSAVDARLEAEKTVKHLQKQVDELHSEMSGYETAENEARGVSASLSEVTEELAAVLSALRKDVSTLTTEVGIHRTQLHGLLALGSEGSHVEPIASMTPTFVLSPHRRHPVHTSTVSERNSTISAVRGSLCDLLELAEHFSYDMQRLRSDVTNLSRRTGGIVVQTSGKLTESQRTGRELHQTIEQLQEDLKVMSQERDGALEVAEYRNAEIENLNLKVKEQSQALEAEKAKLQKTKESMGKEMKELERRASDSRKDIEEKSEEVEGLELEIDKISVQLSDARDEIVTLQHQLHEAKSASDKLQHEIETLTAEKAKFKLQLDEAAIDIEGKTSLADSLKIELESVKSENDSLNYEVSSSKKELKSVKTSWNALKAELDVVKKEKGKLEADLDSRLQELEELRQSSRAEHSQLEERESTALSTVVETEQLLAKLSSKVEDVGKEKEEVEAACITALRLLQSHGSSSPHSPSPSPSPMLSPTKQHWSHLPAVVESFVSTFTDAKSDLARVGIEKESLQSDLRRYEDKLAVTEASLRSCDANLSSLAAEKSELQEHYNELEAQVRRERLDLSDASASVKMQSEEIERLKAALTISEKDCANLKEALDETGAKATAGDYEMAALRRERSKLTDDVRRMGREIQLKDGELERLREDLEAVSNDMSRSNEQWELVQEGLERDNSTLTEKVRHLQKQIRDEEVTRAKLKAESVTTVEEHEDAIEKAVLEAEALCSLLGVEDVHGELDSVLRQLSTHIVDLKQKLRDHEKLLSTVTHLKQQKSDAERGRVTARKERDRIQEELNSSRVKYAELELSLGHDGEKTDVAIGEAPTLSDSSTQMNPSEDVIMVELQEEVNSLTASLESERDESRRKDDKLDHLAESKEELEAKIREKDAQMSKLESSVVELGNNQAQLMNDHNVLNEELRQAKSFETEYNRAKEQLDVAVAEREQLVALLEGARERESELLATSGRLEASLAEQERELSELRHNLDRVRRALVKRTVMADQKQESRQSAISKDENEVSIEKAASIAEEIRQKSEHSAKLEEQVKQLNEKLHATVSRSAEISREKRDLEELAVDVVTSVSQRLGVEIPPQTPDEPYDKGFHELRALGQATTPSFEGVASTNVAAENRTEVEAELDTLRLQTDELKGSLRESQRARVAAEEEKTELRRQLTDAVEAVNELKVVLAAAEERLNASERAQFASTASSAVESEPEPPREEDGAGIQTLLLELEKHNALLESEIQELRERTATTDGEKENLVRQLEQLKRESEETHAHLNHEIATLTTLVVCAAEDGQVEVDEAVAESGVLSSPPPLRKRKSTLDLEEKLGEMVTRSAIAEQEKLEMRGRLSEAQSSINKLQAEKEMVMEECERVITDLREENDELQREVKRLQQWVEQSSTSLQEMTNRVEEANVMCALAESDKSKLEDKLMDMEQQMSPLRQSISSDSEGKEMRPSPHSSILSSPLQHASQTSEQKEWSEKLGDAVTRMAILEQEKADISEELLALKEQNDLLETSVLDLTAQLDELRRHEGDSEHLETENVTLREDVKTLAEQLEGATSELEQVSIECTLAKEHIEELKDELTGMARAEVEAKEMSEELEAAHREIGSLRDVERLQQELVEKVKEYEELVQKQQIEIEKAQSERDQLAGQKCSLEEKVNSLQEENEDIQTRLEDRIQHLTTLVKTGRQPEQRNTAEETDDSRAEIEGLKTDLEEVRQENSAIQASLEKSEAANSMLRKQLEEARDVEQTALSDSSASGQVSELLKENEMLKAKLSDSLNALEESQQREEDVSVTDKPKDCPPTLPPRRNHGKSVELMQLERENEELKLQLAQARQSSDNEDDIGDAPIELQSAENGDASEGPPPVPPRRNHGSSVGSRDLKTENECLKAELAEARKQVEEMERVARQSTAKTRLDRSSSGELIARTFDTLEIDELLKSVQSKDLNEIHLREDLKAFARSFTSSVPHAVSKDIRRSLLKPGSEPHLTSAPPTTGLSKLKKVVSTIGGSQVEKRVKRRSSLAVEPSRASEFSLHDIADIALNVQKQEAFFAGSIVSFDSEQIGESKPSNLDIIVEVSASGISIFKHNVFQQDVHLVAIGLKECVAIKYPGKRCHVLLVSTVDGEPLLISSSSATRLIATVKAFQLRATCDDDDGGADDAVTEESAHSRAANELWRRRASSATSVSSPIMPILDEEVTAGDVVEVEKTDTGDDESNESEGGGDGGDGDGDSRHSLVADTHAPAASLPPPPPPPPPPPAPPAPPPPSGKDGSSTAAGITRRHFYWTKYGQGRVAGTVWQTIQQLEEIELPVKDIDNLFIAKAGARLSRGESLTPNLPSKTSSLPLKRINQIEICLNRLKLSPEKIVEAVQTLDDNTLGVDELRAIEKILLTESERASFAQRDSSADDESRMGAGEKFALQTSRLENFSAKIEGFVIALEFASKANSLENDLNLVIEVAESLQRSRDLPQLLKVILALGNHLNSGTSNGNAHGFAISDLRKLDDIKDKDAQTNLLQYLTTIVCQKFQSLSHGVTDVEDLSAAREVVKDCGSRIENLKAMVSRLEQIVSLGGSDDLTFSTKLKEQLQSFDDRLQPFQKTYDMILDSLKNLISYYPDTNESDDVCEQAVCTLSHFSWFCQKFKSTIEMTAAAADEGTVSTPSKSLKVFRNATFKVMASTVRKPSMGSMMHIAFQMHRQAMGYEENDNENHSDSSSGESFES